MVKLLKSLTKKEVLLSFVSIILIAVQVWFDLKLPDYMNEITILVQTPGSQMSDIYVAGGSMMLVAFGSLVTAVLVSILAAKISTNFGANIRSKLFNKVLDFSKVEMSDFSTASLITRSTNDITQVQMLIVMGLQVLIKSPILSIWAIIKIFDKSIQWTTATAVAVVILLIIIFILIALTIPKFTILQTLTDKLNAVTRENLTGLRVVRAYNAVDYQQNRFETVNTELTATNLFTMRAMTFMMPSIQLIMNGLTIAIYWIGAVLINQAGISDRVTIFSDMVVYMSYAMQIMMAFMMFVFIFLMVPRASVSAKRINQVLDTELSITDGHITENPGTLKGQIEFKNVTFKYPGAEENVLENISFRAEKGETVAVIGSTGSGKSTLVNLIPRFYEVSEGAILVDGVDVKDYKLDTLYNRLGYVSQKAHLFQGTIKSNIAYGDNGRDGFLESDIVEAIYTAQANEFVEKLDDGYDAPVTPAGSNLSGGQKQRVSIARAIARQPEILIFDDSFSALDYQTDRKLRQALRKDAADATKIIVAQRIGTIIDADRIIVLDQGKMVGIGTHQELLETNKTYQEITHSQLSKEELAHE